MTSDNATQRGEDLKNAGRDEVIDQTTGKFKSPGTPDKPKKPVIEQPAGTVMDQNNPFKDEGDAEEFIPEDERDAEAKSEEDGEDITGTDEDDDDGLEDMSFAELKAEAEKRDVDTDGLNTKAKLVAALRAP